MKIIDYLLLTLSVSVVLVSCDGGGGDDSSPEELPNESIEFGQKIGALSARVEAAANQAPPNEDGVTIPTESELFEEAEAGDDAVLSIADLLADPDAPLVQFTELDDGTEAQYSEVLTTDQILGDLMASGMTNEEALKVLNEPLDPKFCEGISYSPAAPTLKKVLDLAKERDDGEDYFVCTQILDKESGEAVAFPSPITKVDVHPPEIATEEQAKSIASLLVNEEEQMIATLPSGDDVATILAVGYQANPGANSQLSPWV